MHPVLASPRVNDDEIGDVVRLALDTFGSGRSARVDPLDRFTHRGTGARSRASSRRRAAS